MSGSSSSAPGAPSALPTAPPDEPLALTVHEVLSPARSGAAAAAPQPRTAAGRWKMLLVLLVCASPVVASYFTYFVIRPEGRTNYGELIQPSRALPAGLPLQNLDGTAVPPASLRGQWLLVAVVDEACAQGCEQRLFMQRQLREMLGRDAQRLEKLVLVAESPTAPVSLRPDLRAALETAPAATVLRAPRDALANWLAPAAGHALDEHLYVVDPMGQWMLRLPPVAEPKRALRDLVKLMRASASWDQPGR
jgi:hypothetical protein